MRLANLTVNFQNTLRAIWMKMSDIENEQIICAITSSSKVILMMRTAGSYKFSQARLPKTVLFETLLDNPCSFSMRAGLIFHVYVLVSSNIENQFIHSLIPPSSMRVSNLIKDPILPSLH